MPEVLEGTPASRSRDENEEEEIERFREFLEDVRPEDFDPEE